MYRQKRPATSKPQGNGFEKAVEGGQDRIFVPAHLQEHFFAFLSMVKREGGDALNEASCAYLEGVMKNGRRISDKEFTALYRLALKQGSTALQEKLDRKFILDKGIVSLREPSLLKSVYGGFNWPGVPESSD